MVHMSTGSVVSHEPVAVVTNFQAVAIVTHFQAAVSNVNCAFDVCAHRVHCTAWAAPFTCLLDLGLPGLALAMASNTGGHLEVDSVDVTCSTAYTVMVHAFYRCVMC